jgi:hypothetical protein
MLTAFTIEQLSFKVGAEKLSISLVNTSTLAKQVIRIWHKP